jgi:hypothetical protein
MAVNQGRSNAENSKLVAAYNVEMDASNALSETRKKKATSQSQKKPSAGGVHVFLNELWWCNEWLRSL